VINDEGHLKHLFWTDTQSRLDYATFGDVVVFDSTYRTNRYNLPFVPFVGLNHHRSTVVFGCAIISNETSEAYEWLLKTFLTAMAHKHPTSVITDGDLAMQKAIITILPNSNHRLCTWHIEQNILRDLHNSKVAEEFRMFLYDQCSISGIERKWEDFFGKESNFK
jgi:zinc finger SWIM domain-containing protein 3